MYFVFSAKYDKRTNLIYLNDACNLVTTEINKNKVVYRCLIGIRQNVYSIAKNIFCSN